MTAFELFVLFRIDDKRITPYSINKLKKNRRKANHFDYCSITYKSR